MNDQPAFERAYRVALRKQLKATGAPAEEAPRKLGLRALKLRLETLDLARIHGEAVAALAPLSSAPPLPDEALRKAGVFFAEVISPLEQTHQSAREANALLQVTIETLSSRTAELAASNDELKQEIMQRKAAEFSLKTSETNTSNLLIKSRAMQDELRLLSRRLLTAQEEERKRISRELHDVISQMLTGIIVRLAALKKRSAICAEDIFRTIEITQELVESSADIVHRFARDLRPAVLDDLGLIPALRSYMKSFMEETGVRVSFTAGAEIEDLPNAGRTVLYRIAQETLINISRHARASRASVTIRSQDDMVHMEIHDDGQGFPADTEEAHGDGGRLGLLGMRERAEMVGGTFSVDSSPRGGTTIRVKIPRTCLKQKKRPVKRSTRAKPKKP